MVVRHAVWLASVGDVLYNVALWLNRQVNGVRRRLGFTYWSLSAWAKHKVKQAVNHMGRFEEVLVAEARREGVDGIVCGHIHHAAIEHYDGITYLNSGDWVESCTALVEHLDGRFEIIRWLDARRRAPALRPAARRRVHRSWTRRLDAYPHRHRRLGAAGERGGALAREFVARSPASRRRDRDDHARDLPHRAVADLSPRCASP